MMMRMMMMIEFALWCRFQCPVPSHVCLRDSHDGSCGPCPYEHKVVDDDDDDDDDDDVNDDVNDHDADLLSVC